MKKIKVSVIMGVYNCEKTLVASIESLINQTYDNWELIICDDASIDGTLDIAKLYENKYKNKIKLIRNKKNMTLGPTLNRCLKLAKGEYVARLDGDDTYEKIKLEKQIKFLDENRGFDLVGTSMNCFDDNGVYGRRNLKEKPVSKDLLKGTTFAHATIMIKTDVIKALKGYSEHKNSKGVEDYELWFRFFAAGYNGFNINECLYNVREDKWAYRRKNYRRRVNEIITLCGGVRILKLSYVHMVYIIKPIIAMMIPNIILHSYHKLKFSGNILEA